MTTPQPPASPADMGVHHRQAGPPDTIVTVRRAEPATVVQTAAYLCAGGFVASLLTGATTLAWLLLAAALIADTATYGLRARHDRALRGYDPTALPHAAARRLGTPLDADPQ